MNVIPKTNTVTTVIPLFAPVNVTSSRQIPEGYTPSHEFWNNMDAKIKTLCKEHGIL
ncbi:hypothetical protein FACS189421_00690 [Bacteroidia bacterium]|nr:hypothetical protein FACS189421_00690 [Bacteroidia bacterium]GHT50967.1 hypothetical protein FACS189440_19300 [Bacteroidia bacterium]